MAKKIASKKKISVKKTASKTALKPAAKKTAAKKKDKTTKVIVKYDCGFSNHLSIRGEGAGLSWYKGTPLKNLSQDEWIFDVVFPESHLEFKILINDQVFEIGDNHKVKNGQSIQIAPQFH